MHFIYLKKKKRTATATQLVQVHLFDVILFTYTHTLALSRMISQSYARLQESSYL